MNGYQTINMSKYFDIAHDYSTVETVALPWKVFVDGMERIKKAEDAGVPVVIGGVVMPTVEKTVESGDSGDTITYEINGPTGNRLVSGYAYVDTNDNEVVIDFGVNHATSDSIIHTYAVITVDEDDEDAICSFMFVDQTPVTIS